MQFDKRYPSWDWDPDKKVFRLWYMAGKREGSGLAYAESKDEITTTGRGWRNLPARELIQEPILPHAEAGQTGNAFSQYDYTQKRK